MWKNLDRFRVQYGRYFLSFSHFVVFLTTLWVHILAKWKPSDTQLYFCKKTNKQKKNDSNHPCLIYYSWRYWLIEKQLNSFATVTCIVSVKSKKLLHDEITIHNFFKRCFNFTCFYRWHSLQIWLVHPFFGCS